MPQFSLIIPTRNRLETLRVSLESALAQPDADIEILVADNASNDGTQAFLKSLSDPRIVGIRSEEPLSMQHNWARALEHATGDWVTIIGDDDAFMPDFVRTAKVVARQDAEIIGWSRPNYRWPSFVAEHERNRLVFTIGSRSYWADSKKRLTEVYTTFADAFGVPSVYHHLIKRSLIERIRQTLGDYPMSISPDMGSGLLNLAFTDRYIQLEWPLTVLGYSAKSSGAAVKYTKPGSQERAEFTTLEPELAALQERYPMQGLFTTESATYQILLDMRQYLSRVGLEFNPDFASFAKWQASRVHLVHPDERADMIDKLKALCAEFNITDIQFPTEVTTHPVGYGKQQAFFNVATDGSGVVNGRFDFTGTPIVNVYQAACILRSLVPHIG